MSVSLLATVDVRHYLFLPRKDLPACSLSTYYLQVFGRMCTILSRIVLARRRKPRVNGSSVTINGSQLIHTVSGTTQGNTVGWLRIMPSAIETNRVVKAQRSFAHLVRQCACRS